jgi:hypothetical protein
LRWHAGLSQLLDAWCLIVLVYVCWTLAVQVTQLERAMNVLVFVQFSALLVFSAVLAGLDQWWTISNSSGLWYLPPINRWPELAPGGLGWFVSVSVAAAAPCMVRLLAAVACMLPANCSKRWLQTVQCSKPQQLPDHLPLTCACSPVCCSSCASSSC